MKNIFRPIPNILRLSLMIFISLIAESTTAQNHQERYNTLDVLNYTFEIAVNDSTNRIAGKAIIRIAFKKDLEAFTLDLKNVDNKGRGMIIEEVIENDKRLEFTHQNNQIKIFHDIIKKDDIKIYLIKYNGIPDDGLIISTNKFGDRVFFGDSWPNRAHHWLPTVDHPSDKALVEFIVKAPSHYQVVANGVNIEETNSGNAIISHWKTYVPLPTKLMAIGVARFAKQNFINAEGIPLSSWVYPQNRDEGFSDYKITLKPLAFFSENIAPYPFAKLANVQSKTIFGGMENAGCIFYSERSVTGNNEHELLFAHEIAHQWFGDAVSELDWHHIWLSEGFATYFTGLYIENQEGKKEFKNWLKIQRYKVLKYANYKLSPVIDTTLEVSVGLLSPNSYQKGAWFLHMLRKELGDELFWQSIRTYYKKHEYSNVLTEDFQAVIESESRLDFNDFFKQWLYRSGHPKLFSQWKFNEDSIQINISQKQENTIFKFPLEIQIIYEDNSSSFETIKIDEVEEIFNIKSGKKPKEIILDPNIWLLFETVEPTK